MQTSPGGQKIGYFIVRISRDDGAERSRYGRQVDNVQASVVIGISRGRVRIAGLLVDGKYRYSRQSTTAKRRFTSNKAGTWQY